jgi:transposase
MQEPTVREQWAKRVERWKDSGLSAKEFAAETGLNAHSLSWWRWQLSKGDTAAEPQRRRRSRAAIRELATLSPMKFVEMTTAPVTLEKLEVVLPSTIRVCVRPGFDAATLGRLLDVLEQRR